MGGAAVLTALLAGGAAAQISPNNYWNWRFGYLPSPTYQGRTTQTQWGELATPTSPLAPSLPGGPPRYHAGFQGLESIYPPRYPPFPTYPRGYGPAPRVGGFLPLVKPEPDLVGAWRPDQLLPEAERRRGWPSWIAESIEADERAATPERAVLARAADRIWFMAADETVFVPLSYYDKFRLVESGALIEVRNKGEFQLVFHDSALLRSVGGCRLGVPRLAEEQAELQLRHFDRMWLTAKTRLIRLLLPDGSALEVEDAEVYLERRGGRGLIHNEGPSAVPWKGRVGARELLPGHRLDILVEPAHKPFLAASLEVEGAVEVERDGPVVLARGGAGGGVVTWSGARIPVPEGAVLELDALAGSEFPENVR